jgi:hypothetical protein
MTYRGLLLTRFDVPAVTLDSRPEGVFRLILLRQALGDEIEIQPLQPSSARGAGIGCERECRAVPQQEGLLPTRSACTKAFLRARPDGQGEVAVGWSAARPPTARKRATPVRCRRGCARSRYARVARAQLQRIVDATIEHQYCRDLRLRAAGVPRPPGWFVAGNRALPSRLANGAGRPPRKAIRSVMRSIRPACRHSVKGADAADAARLRFVLEYVDYRPSKLPPLHPTATR